MNTMRCGIAAGLVLAVLAAQGCGKTPRGEIERLKSALEQAPDDLDKRMELADAHYEQGKLDEAARTIREGLLLSPDEPRLVRYMANLYNRYVELTDSDQKIEMAIRYWEKVQTLSPEKNGTALEQLAWLNNRADNTQNALKLARKALELDPDSDFGNAQAAYACLDLGRYEQGQLHIAKALEKKPQTPHYLLWKAELQFRLGEYEASLDTLDVLLQLSMPDSLRESAVGSRDYARRLAIAQPSHSGAIAHWGSGDHHRARGRYDLAIREYKLAVERTPDDGNRKGKERVAACIFEVGSMYTEADRKEEALPYVERGIELTKEIGRIDWLGPSYQVLAGIYGTLSSKDKSRRDEFLRMEIEARRLQEEWSWKAKNDHMAYHALAELINAQYNLYGLEGVVREDRTRLQRLLPQDDRVIGCDRASVTRTESTLCMVEENYQRAQELLEACRDYYENSQYPSDRESAASVLTQLALLARKHNDHESAIAYLQKALEHMEGVRARTGEDSFKSSIGESTVEWAGANLVRSALALQDPTRALTFSEQTKGRVLLDLLGTATAQEKKGAGNREAEQQEQLVKVNQLASLADEARQANNTERLRSLERTLSVERTKYNRLEEDLESAGKRVASFESIESLDGGAVAALAQDFTFVSYTMSDSGLFVLVAGPAGVSGKRNNKSKSEDIAALLHALRAELDAQSVAKRDLQIEGGPEAEKGVGAVENAAAELYARLIAPIREQLSTNLVIISPDDQLNFLPFELLEDENGRRLIEDFTIAYAPSASVLKYCMDRQRTRRESVLALGNPNLRNPAFRLYHAEEEVRAFEGIFPQARVAVFDEATESLVKKAAADYDVLHFACHGELHPSDPMLTCLRLAPDGDNDGYLHAGEVFDQQLDASLVVLSACESGLGQIYTGNELLGLTRSFLYAGAPAVISSLWKVDDRSTAFLMQAFYRNLRTMSKAEALRQAKLATMKAFPEPFHWAAFCLQGDYR